MKRSTYVIYRREDASVVEPLLAALTDRYGHTVWFDRWDMVAGASCQQQMAKGIEASSSALVFMRSNSPIGWAPQELEVVKLRQAKEPAYPIVSVLLPGSDPEWIPPFLAPLHYLDLRNCTDLDHQLHQLDCAIRGVPCGRWPVQKPNGGSTNFKTAADRLHQLKYFRQIGVDRTVLIELQRRTLDEWYDKEGGEDDA
ncbi:MAG: repeat protein [Gammaproteobacteria bacterium]|nr:repeat protein [Gammaproteobacteria bacterium]